jgi:hypothetical protein
MARLLACCSHMAPEQELSTAISTFFDLVTLSSSGSISASCQPLQHVLQDALQDCNARCGNFPTHWCVPAGIGLARLTSHGQTRLQTSRRPDIHTNTATVLSITYQARKAPSMCRATCHQQLLLPPSAQSQAECRHATAPLQTTTKKMRSDTGS